MRLKDHLSFWIKYYKHDLPVENIQLSSSENERLDLYCKLDNNFVLKKPIKANSISKTKSTGYAYDWFSIIDRDDERFCNIEFGDVNRLLTEPTFVKSRPISLRNENNVILPLDTIRHLHFVDDNFSFKNKKDIALWRGAVYQPHRIKFIDKNSNSNLCNIADTGSHTKKGFLGKSINYLPIKNQLQYKFIFAIEGNDVASNLKWIMSSNSIPIMPKPKFETWFAESLLEPEKNFIEIDDDFSNVDSQIEFYLARPKLCMDIIKENHRYVSDFQDIGRQYALARLVSERYFDLTS